MGGERAVELKLEDVTRRQTVALRPGESQEVEFRVEGLKVGVHQGTVRIVGEDALAADNARFFTVEVKPPWRVLVAATKPAQRCRAVPHRSLGPDACPQAGPGAIRLPGRGR